ncbi:hypothetical protein Ancab_017933 [Ancistrocladus abbreviatus]
MLDQTGRSGDIVGAFNEALPRVEASACEETQSPRVDGIIKAMEGSQKETFYREAYDIVQLMPVDWAQTKSLQNGLINESEQVQPNCRPSSYVPPNTYWATQQAHSTQMQCRANITKFGFGP